MLSESPNLAASGLNFPQHSNCLSFRSIGSQADDQCRILCTLLAVK